MKKVSVIILAAGKGTRMKAKVNKQFLNLKDKPVLYYSIKAFEENDKVDEIIIVASDGEISYIKEYLVSQYSFSKVKNIVKGGEERQQSVLAGLKALKNSSIVLIHDGARPFVSKEIIDNGIKYAEEFGACACGVTPKDTIKIKGEDNFSKETPKRETLFAVQTPQSFQFDLIYNCHVKLQDKNISVTDDTMVAELFGHKIYLYEGAYTNIKITTPEDLVLGESLLK